MARISDLSEDYLLDAAALADRGVSTVDDLWACISRNVDHGVKRVASQTQMNRDVLLAFLIADALDDPKRRYRPRPVGMWVGLKPLWWLRARAQRFWGTRGSLWPDLLLFSLPFLIIGLGVAAQQLNQQVVQRVAVKSGVTLPAFVAIDTNKLTTRAVMDEPGSFASINDLNQRYPLRDLGAGELVKDGHLVPHALSGSLAGRRFVSVPIKNSSSVASAQPMDHVKLIFAPRDKDKSGVVLDKVIFLSLKKEGETTFAQVAIPETETTHIEGLLGTCDIFVSQTIR